PGNIESALNALSVVVKWKDDLLIAMVEGLRNLKFPNLPAQTEFDLTQQRQLVVEDLPRIPKDQIFEKYNEFMHTMEVTRQKVIAASSELRTKISSVSSRSTTLFEQKIDDYDDSRSIRRDLDSSYGEVLQEWWNLKSHLQWQKEVLLTYINNDIGKKLSVLQELPKPLNEFFQNTTSFLYEKSQGAQDKDIEEVLRDYNIIQEKIVEYTEDDYRKLLQTGVLPSIRVALPRIREIIQLPPRIAEVEDSIEGAITTQRDFTAIISSAAKLIGFYNEVVKELKRIAKEQSVLLVREIDRLAASGLDLKSKVPAEVYDFADFGDKSPSQGKNDQKRSFTIKEITECFVAIDDFRTNQSICKMVRGESIKHVNDVRRAIRTVADLYGFNIEEKFPIIQVYVSEEFERDIARDNIFTLADLFVSLVQFKDDFIVAIRALEEDQVKNFEAKLIADHKYYPVVREVFEQNKKELEKVVAMGRILRERDEAAKTSDLSVLTDMLPKLRQGRADLEKEIAQLARWHRAFKMFVSYLTVADGSEEKSISDDERQRQFDDIKKRIQTTFKSNQKIRMYLISAIKTYGEGRAKKAKNMNPEND
ncbi:MAG TPA: hypothetical protein VJ044_09410, partial [Candidatus Hodarchaeales archaeon]|nr:hypothetical protein [Candidatus Hodarchaeales archaeon]